MVEVSTVVVDLDFLSLVHEVVICRIRGGEVTGFASTLVLPWQFDFLVPGLFGERNCRFRGIGPMKQ